MNPPGGWSAMTPPGGPGSAPLQPSLLSGPTTTNQGVSGAAAGGDDGGGIVVPETRIVRRVPFEYWVKEAQYATKFEANHPGEELPRNEWTIRFGDREAKLHHRLTAPLNLVDAPRWDFENSLLYSAQFEASTYIVIKHLVSSFDSYVWTPRPMWLPRLLFATRQLSPSTWTALSLHPSTS